MNQASRPIRFTKLNKLLHVDQLTISFPGTPRPAVDGLSFSLLPGETLAIVGESGSGKTVTCMALTGLLGGLHTMTAEAATFQVENHLFDLQQPAETRKSLLGKHIGFMFQDPMSSLNPSMRVGKQVAEGLRYHLKITSKQAHDEVVQLFQEVGLPDPEEIFQRYPHELSGGQKQRVMMAMAISCKPALLLADEPTTALDATVQRQVLRVLKKLQKSRGMALIFITHDLEVAASVANKVLVMRKGQCVEWGPTEAVFQNPAHEYTKALIQCRPKKGFYPRRLPTVEHILSGEKPAPHEILESIDRPALLEIQNLKVVYTQRGGHKGNARPVLNGIGLTLHEGETLGLVGESGSGKSTVAKAILGLVQPAEGTILYRGTDLTQLDASGWRKMRSEIQMVFQDPYSSLNPRMRVENILLEPLKAQKKGGSLTEKREFIKETLQKVGLPEESLKKYPHAFSGGQRQRIGIARALMLRPKLLILDESVAALDVSVQAQVLNLLNDLKDEFGFSYLFISHDLAVVDYMSQNLVVLDQGKVVEEGPAHRILEKPTHPYTQKLVEASENPA